jgi:DNA-binding NarL/FixJ family response regulator
MKNNKIKVLILSDRLLDEAKVLAGYLRCTGKFEITGIARSRREVLSIAQKQAFDYLIIAGYLKAESGYAIISELQNQQRKFLPVQWAILDELIYTLCRRYSISLKFDRTLPLADFVSYLESAFMV